MPFTYANQSRNLIRVDRDGVFAGYLARFSHRSSGLHGQRYDYWQGQIAGVEIKATSLTAAKLKIFKSAAVEPEADPLDDFNYVGSRHHY